jgi:hypothetical protein
MNDLVPRAKARLVKVDRSDGRRVISMHIVNRVMFEPQEVHVHPAGKFLCVRILHGRVELHMEEPSEAAEDATIRVQGFRAGARIPEGAAYLGTVFEREVDYGHIYILAPK